MREIADEFVAQLGIEVNFHRCDVEVQGTGEHGTLARAQLDQLLELAISGIRSPGRSPAQPTLWQPSPVAFSARLPGTEEVPFHVVRNRFGGEQTGGPEI